MITLKAYRKCVSLIWGLIKIGALKTESILALLLFSCRMTYVIVNLAVKPILKIYKNYEIYIYLTKVCLFDLLIVMLCNILK